MTTTYEEFLTTKLRTAPATGLTTLPAMPDWLFPFQADLTRWSLRRGRAAVFADTGMGKTRVELQWAHTIAEHTGQPVIILAPLAVAQQTVREGAKVGVHVTLCRSASDVQPGVNVTNYDRLHRFDASVFGGMVADESSIIKHHDAKTLQQLLDAFARTPFKLCGTATPAPNDYTELGTHAEFLGVCTRSEMLSEFFVHDGGETQTWRLKGHARKAFWKWLASWGAMVRRPSDLGYSDEGFILPALNVQQHVIATDEETVKASGMLFAVEAKTLSDQRVARRASIGSRVAACAARANADDDPWIIWCDLNAESEALTRAIRGAVEVRGSDEIEEKESRIASFIDQKARAIVSKSSIMGFGLNLQHCANMAFVGVTHSFESYYQAVRRCWRFGQTRPVNVHIYASEAEGAVIANLERKERDSTAMAEALAAETRDEVRREVRGTVRDTTEYRPGMAMRVPEWLCSKEDVA